MKSLWLMPGQGGQKANMLANVTPTLKKKVEELLKIKFEDSDAGYQDSLQIQLSILLLQIDQVDQLKKLGWQPDIVAGHSLGVFAAAYAANVIKQDDVFKLVALRAKLMKAAYPQGYGMGVIVGIARSEIQKIVDQLSTPKAPVYLSNQNSELQNTVSGQLEAVKKVLEMARKQGATKVKVLKVPNPSHSPLMKKVAYELNQFLGQLDLEQPSCIYLANYNGHATRDLKSVMYDLANNLAYPVYWETMMQIALEYQPDVSCEFSPNTTFTKLLKAKTNQLHNVTLATMSVDDADYLFNKWRKN